MQEYFQKMHEKKTALSDDVIGANIIEDVYSEPSISELECEYWKIVEKKDSEVQVAKMQVLMFPCISFSFCAALRSNMRMIYQVNILEVGFRDMPRIQTRL